MKANLRLGKVFNLRDGMSGEETPAWVNVEGLPDGQWAKIQSEGGPRGMDRWRIKTNAPSVGDETKNRVFATQEKALEALQKEVG
jgi:hypothetical protein